MTQEEWLERFSYNLLRRLYDFGMEQKELAYRASLAESTISRYINGKQVPDARGLLNMSYALGCTVDELIDFGELIE